MPLINSVARVATQRMPKAITPKAHAIIDYLTIGAFLVTGAGYWRGHKRAALSAFFCAGAELALNLMTDYPGGIKKEICFPTHCKIDFSLASMSAGMPDLSGLEDDRGRMYFL